MSYYGVYQGVVTGTKDPQKRGRIKVMCPDVTGDIEIGWCDPVVPVAYDGGGDFYIPEVSDTVWIMFIRGDVNYPVWLGGWWQKNMTPLGDDYSEHNKTRIINFADCTITMKDGKIEISVNDGDSEVVIENRKIHLTGNVVIDGNLNVNGKINVADKSNLSSVEVDGKLHASGSINSDGEVHGTNI